MTLVHILVAEDDDNIREGLIDILESEGYKVTPAIDGEEVLLLYEKIDVDLILLDIMMPGKSGYDVCRAIRAKDSSIPIIMLTAKGEEIDKVVGLQLGADDYITKPFGLHELLARIGAVLRRSQRHDGESPNTSNIPPRFMFGRTEIDTRQFKAYNENEIFDLTARELQLILFFHENPDVVLSRDQLLNAVWGIDYYGTTRTLDQHIAQVRKKVEPDPHHPSIITTVHGIGYRYRTYNP